MRLALLSPWAEGYYQRMVLDRWQRIPMRLLGALISLFGFVILTAALGGLLRVPVISGASTGLLVLLWLVFIGAWVFGLVFVVVRLAQRRSLGWMDWIDAWKRGTQLGLIDVHPLVTPAMQRESNAFTVTFWVLVAAALLVGPHLP
jgi:uncharacterized membrane protein (DUF485 family)